jgi:hypothetical protein
MLSHNKVAEQIELQDVIFGGSAVGEALQIEEVLNRAHEIHRAHGGLLGYDLEDWLQAERELVGRNRPGHFQADETEQSVGNSRNRRTVRDTVCAGECLASDFRLEFSRKPESVRRRPEGFPEHIQE